MRNLIQKILDWFKFKKQSNQTSVVKVLKIKGRGMSMYQTDTESIITIDGVTRVVNSTNIHTKDTIIPTEGEGTISVTTISIDGGVTWQEFGSFPLYTE